MRARAAAIAAALFFCHHVMTKGGKYPPSIIQFLFTIQVKKDIARHDILDSMHENARVHEISVMASPLVYFRICS